VPRAICSAARSTRRSAKISDHPESVDKHIAYIHEVIDATSRGTPRQVATRLCQKIRNIPPATTGSDKHRRAATCRDRSDLSRYVDRLEDENEFREARSA